MTPEEVFEVIQAEAEGLVRSGAAANMVVATNRFLETPSGVALANLHRKLSDATYDPAEAERGERMLAKLARRDFTELPPPPPLPIPESETGNAGYKFLARVATELRDDDHKLSPGAALEKAQELHPEAREAYLEHVRLSAAGAVTPDRTGFGAVLEQHGVTAFELLQAKAEEYLENGEVRSLNEGLEVATKRHPELMEAHSQAMRR